MHGASLQALTSMRLVDFFWPTVRLCLPIGHHLSHAEQSKTDRLHPSTESKELGSNRSPVRYPSPRVYEIECNSIMWASRQPWWEGSAIPSVERRVCGNLSGKARKFFALLTGCQEGSLEFGQAEAEKKINRNPLSGPDLAFGMASDSANHVHRPS